MTASAIASSVDFVRGVAVARCPKRVYLWLWTFAFWVFGLSSHPLASARGRSWFATLLLRQGSCFCTDWTVSAASFRGRLQWPSALEVGLTFWSDHLPCLCSWHSCLIMRWMWLRRWDTKECRMLWGTRDLGIWLIACSSTLINTEIPFLSTVWYRLLAYF